MFRHINKLIYTHGFRHKNLNNNQKIFRPYISRYFSEKPKQDPMLDKIDETLKQAAQKENQFEDDSSFEREKDNSSSYIFGVGALGLILGYVVMQVNMMRHDNKKKMGKPQSYKGRADIGGDWTLTDTQGKQFSSEDLKGSYYLIYFGFCNCPDICPNSLMKLGKALDKLKVMPEAKYINLKSIFVSVDPDRDSYSKIDRFLSIFHKDFIGLTAESNESPNLKDMLKKFRIYASRIEFDQMDDTDKEIAKKEKDWKKAYTIDHTVLTYLMDDQNRYVCHIGSNLNEHDIASLITEKVMENERNKINEQ